MGRAVAGLARELDHAAAGRELHDLCRALYPIPRSLTGDGVRRTLALLGERIPLDVHEVPSGTKVLDWTVPDEWTVRGAYIVDPAGRRIADFERHSLHLVGYSEPVDTTLALAELKGHLHSLPEQPGRIPYRTSYYRRNWGFCLSDHELRALPDGSYRAVVDATLAPGHLTYGECLLPGAEPAEVLVSCHVCHPALANDNLSGIAVASCLARALAQCDRRWTYRFLFIPGTIGSITWLARNEDAAGRIRAGLVAANLGDPGTFHYKRSRRGDAWIDGAVEKALGDLGEELKVESFVPYGYDERQYCSPGFDLPVGSLTRTPWGRYPEYHTSGDDLDFIRPEPLAGALAAYLAVAEVLEGDRRFENLSPKGEPQLGRRGLYGSLGGTVDKKERELALLWVLNLADGRHTLLDVARRSGMPFAAVAEAARALQGAGLLKELPLEGGAAALTR